MVITGNVQVTKDHMTLGRDLLSPVSLLPRDSTDDERAASDCAAWVQLARVIHGPVGHETGALALLQLSHAGRQSPTFFGGRPLFHPALAPSAVPLDFRTCAAAQAGSIGRLLSDTLSTAIQCLSFPTPQAMTTEEVEQAVEAFVKAARIAESNDFDGIELHASHGCESLVATSISSC